MSWSPAVLATIKRLQRVPAALRELFTGRDRAIDLLPLATVCQEHLLLVGPPGTAKTELLTRYADLIDARGFSYLLTRFTEPSELFGPLDLAAFQKGTYRVSVAGMLPEAQIAFLDEVFQGSSPILNALLGIIHERVFHNGAVRQRVPLGTLVGATNILPDDPWLMAFADRFVLRAEVDPVPDELIDDLLDQGWVLETERIEAAARAAKGQPVGRTQPLVKYDEVLDLHARLREVDLKAVRPEYSAAIKELRAEGVGLTDRRVVKGLKLTAGAALLRGSDVAGPRDLWPLLHVWGRPEEAAVIRRVLQPRLQDGGGPAADAARAVADVLLDREALLNQEGALRSDGGRSAHLAALTKLRRELVLDHPRDDAAKALLRQIEEDVARVLLRMGGPSDV